MKRRFAILIATLLVLFMLLPAPALAVVSPTPINPLAGSVVANPVNFQWTAGGGPNYTLELTNLSTLTITTVGGITSTSYSTYLTTGPWSWRVKDTTPSWSASQAFTVIAPSISLNPSQGYLGTVFAVYGYNWQPGETIKIYYDGFLQQTLFPATVNWTTVLTASGAIGYHTISAVGTISGSQAVTFYVTGPPPYISQSITQGSPGGQVTITGYNFNPYEAAYVTFAGSVIVSGSASSAGSWTLYFTIPEKPAGNYIVDAYGSTTLAGAVPDLSLAVRPLLTANPATAEVAAQISISGKGYLASTTVTLSYDGKTFSATSNALGSFSMTITTPNKGGNYTLTASDGTYSATAGFAVVNPLTASISPSTGAVGEEATLTGNGKVPGTITVAYDGVTIGTTETRADGGFSLSLTIPKSSAGYHTLTATDSAGNTFSVLFAMESTPPPAPTPLKPSEKSNEGWTFAEVTFGWSGVTDPSGVTYNLRVGSILLATGLTTTEYQAEFTEQGTYYWYVQAVDGAGNQSGWSPPRSFVIGYPIPPWSMWAIGGGSVTLAGLVTILVRRLRKTKKATPEVKK